MNNHAPDLEQIRLVNAEHRIIGIGRTKLDISILPVSQVEVLDGKLTVPEGHDDRAVMRFHGTVNDYPVAIEDARILH